MHASMDMVAISSCIAATKHIVPSTEHARLMATKYIPPRRCSLQRAAMTNRLPAAPHTVAAITTRGTGMLLARVNAAAMMPQQTVTEYVVWIMVFMSDYMGY